MQKSGVDNIKGQLFPFFSFNETVNRLQFFIASIITLPITISMYFGTLIAYEKFRYAKQYYYGDTYLKYVVMGLIALTLFFIFGWVFLSFLQRRLRDLNLHNSEILFMLFVVNICVVSILFFLLVTDLIDMSYNGREIFELFSSVVIFIDIIFLLFLFFLKGVDNVSQE